MKRAYGADWKRCLLSLFCSLSFSFVVCFFPRIMLWNFKAFWDFISLSGAYIWLELNLEWAADDLKVISSLYESGFCHFLRELHKKTASKSLLSTVFWHLFIAFHMDQLISLAVINNLFYFQLCDIIQLEVK